MMFMNLEFPYEPLIDLSEGETIILLHGLFGNLSNWQLTIGDK